MYRMVNPPCLRSALATPNCRIRSPDLSPEAPIYLNSPLTEKLQVPQWLISATPPEFNHLQTTGRLGFEQYFARLVLHDVARNRARGNGQRRGQIHLSWTAATGEIAVLRADHHLIRTSRNSGSGVDAGSATGLDHVRAGLLKHVQVAFANAVLARFLRSKLNVELHRVSHALALLQRIGQHGSVHIHVFVLAGGAGSSIGNFDRHRRVELTHILPVAWIARGRNHRSNLGGVELDHMRVPGIRIAEQALDHSLGFCAIHTASLNQEINRFFVGRDDAGESTDLGRHVGHGSALVNAEPFNRFARILHPFGECLAGAHIIEAQNFQNEILRRDIRMALASNYDPHRLWHLDADIFRDPAVEHVSGSDAESDAANCADMRSMRVRAYVKLSWQRVALKHDRVADAFRTLAVFQLPMELDSLLNGEVLLFQFQLGRKIEQSELLFLLRNYLIEKRQMVTEKDNA